jgi:hypothetical protein
MLGAAALVLLAAAALPSPAAALRAAVLVLLAAAALPSPAAALGTAVLVLLAAAALPSPVAGVNMMVMLSVFPNFADFTWLLASNSIAGNKSVDRCFL